MIKQITVTFDFDTETENVSNVKVVNNTEKKKTTTKRLKDVETEMASTALITLESNKLVFNSKAVYDLELEWEDRVIVKWVKEGNKMIPIIGKDISFDEEGSGNKVTKTNTVTYRGKANDVLAELGSEFTLGVHDEGIWKLIPTKDSIVSEEGSLETLVEKAVEVKAELIVDDEEETEIDELQFKL